MIQTVEFHGPPRFTPNRTHLDHYHGVDGSVSALRAAKLTHLEKFFVVVQMLNTTNWCVNYRGTYQPLTIHHLPGFDVQVFDTTYVLNSVYCHLVQVVGSFEEANALAWEFQQVADVLRS